MNPLKMVSKKDYEKYLSSRVASLVRENFPEKGVTNLLTVKWGIKSKRMLGSIKTLQGEGHNGADYASLIQINSFLKSTEIPEYVLDYVIMHELTHYFHGFGSNHQKKSKHPHRGKVVEKELARRGWGEITIKAEKWLKENWKNIIAK